jgi:hypothetical protein
MLPWEVRRSVENMFRHLKSQDFAEALSCLHGVADNLGYGNGYPEALGGAIKARNWSQLGSWFNSHDFISPSGLFLLVAPYKRRRSGQWETELTGVFGIVAYRDPVESITAAAQAMFEHPSKPAQVIGFVRVSSFGLSGGERGEAFLVPNAWQFPGSTGGPALNDMAEQAERFRVGQLRLQEIFTPATLAILTRPLADTISGSAIRNREFQFHEIAHEAGLGFKAKLAGGFFKSAHNCALEEWRSDGVAFALMSQVCSEAEHAQLIAANLVLRFAVDAQRRGGENWDPDALASALTLQSLWETGRLQLRGGRIHMDIDNVLDLRALTARHAEVAASLTKTEYKADIKDVSALYSKIELSEKVEGIFDSIIAPSVSGSTMRSIHDWQVDFDY